MCPNSDDGGVLRISWGAPSVNAESVVDYVVEVLEYYQPRGSQVVETRPISSPFRQEVQSLMTMVTSGVGELLLWSMPFNFLMA